MSKSKASKKSSKKSSDSLSKKLVKKPHLKTWSKDSSKTGQENRQTISKTKILYFLEKDPSSNNTRNSNNSMLWNDSVYVV